MNKRLYFPLAVMAILALALSACVDEAANPADIDYWPWNWGNRTLESTLADKCEGLPAGSSVPVNGAQVPCPDTEAESPTTNGGEYVAPTPEAEAEAPAVATSDGEFISGESRTVNGPAMVQLWDGKTVPGCGIYKIPAGYRLTWALRGHFWLFEGVNEVAFNAAFAASEADYDASNPQCQGVNPDIK